MSAAAPGPSTAADTARRAASSTLRARALPLADPAEQRRRLDAADLAAARHGGDFGAALAAAGRDRLAAARLEIFQINLGRLCNMTCRHCHVDAGPDRADQAMDRATVDACLAALDRSTAHTVDLTGGAPELNPHFRELVEQSVARGRHVVDRCNLTVLLLPAQRCLPEWLAEIAHQALRVLAQCPDFSHLPPCVRIRTCILATLLHEMEAISFQLAEQRLGLTPLRKLWIAWRES